MQVKAKFLVIRFSSIGDIVLTTPVLRCLKEQFDGEAEIHYLTKASFIPILEHNPYVDKVLGIEKSTNEHINELKREDYDFIIDLHKNARSLRVKRRLKVVDMSFKKLNFEKWLMVNFKKNRLPDRHIVDRYLDTVAPWGVKNDQKGLDYFLSEEIMSMSLDPFFDNDFIALTVGGGHYTKTMPAEKMIEMIDGLSLPVALMGGKEDQEKAESIASKVKNKVYNACGKFTLSESANIVRKSAMVIAHDTGLKHISAAFNKKIISIWGNTIPEFGMYAYEPQKPENVVIIENKELSCRPCSKLGFDKCPKKHFKCMNDLDLDEIYQKSKLFLTQD